MNLPRELERLGKTRIDIYRELRKFLPITLAQFYPALAGVTYTRTAQTIRRQAEIQIMLWNYYENERKMRKK